MNEELFERPWIEKYRPELLNDVVGITNYYLGNKEVITQLREIAKRGNIPHMILVVFLD